MEAYMQPAAPQQEKLKCPRCDSTNTKFCYYNNYNLSQPRHFCKGCRRYWTKGGALRNIPVGGGSKKAAAKRGAAVNRPASTEERSESEAVFSLNGDYFGQGQFGNFPGFGGNDEGYFGQFGELGSLAGMGEGFGSSSGPQFDGFGLGNYYYGDLSLGQDAVPQTDGFFNIGGDDGECNGGWPDLAI